MTTTTQQHNELHEGEVVEQGLVKVVDSIVKPAVSPKEALENWKLYQEITTAIATEDDYQEIEVWDASKQQKIKKKLPKKSLWRKRATFFNLTAELSSEKEIKNEDGSIDFDVIYKVTAPNGRSTIGDGSCNSREKNRENSRHNTRSTAHTRAFNRAVSNLIGGGEVSAEEFVDDEPSSPAAPHGRQPGKKEPVILEDDYRIDLGDVKVKGESKPHWLNGMTLKEASEQINRATKQSILKDSYDFYKDSAFKNQPHVRKFLAHVEAFWGERDSSE